MIAPTKITSPPHSPEAERAVLAALLLEPTRIREVAGQIGPEDFHDHRHTLIFRTLEDMVAHGKAVDLVTVTQEMRDAKHLDEVGGPAYITNISEAAPTAAFLSHHVEIVRKNSALRRTIDFAERLRESAGNSCDDPAALLEDAQRQLGNLAEVAGPAGANVRGGIENSLVDSAALRTMAVEPREYIVRPFFKAGDLGFIFAKRGDGKTWLTMLLARAAASGGTAGPWRADARRKLLYVDGEMPAEETKRRDKALGDAADSGLVFLHHEIYFERTGRTLNLAEPGQQDAMTRLLVDGGFNVLVLDNLSCLFSGLKENDADSWEAVLPWLLNLRRLKIAVVIVAHAGRNGQMRGTSRREDQAFWVLRLERGDSDGTAGLRFTSVFTKNRNALEDDCPPLEWTITVTAGGAASVTAKPVSGVDLLVSWVEAGLDTASDIAQETGLSKGQVSKLAKRAVKLGRITIKHRHYWPAGGGIDDGR